MLSSMKGVARRLKKDTLAVYFAARDKRTPLIVRLLAIMVAVYALSPVDLIPDFIPIIGYLDDLIIIPLGLALIIRLTPEDVMAQARIKASEAVDKPVSYSAAAFIVALWLLAVFYVVRLAFGLAAK